MMLPFVLSSKFSLDYLEFYAHRARGGVGLIVTGGIAPNDAGRTAIGAAKMTSTHESDHHKIVTEAVHNNGGLIAMQILHTGRYGYHFNSVSASAVKSPISWFTPKALTSKEVHNTISDFARCAELAKRAGYDGVEIMGSEGYLINQFIVKRTNKRNDEWGGSYANRIRFPQEIVKAVRKACGKDFIIIYRLSMLDLVEDGSSWEEIVELAKRIEDAGASIINTGIGWHEARIPTIATSVPRAAFTWVTKKMKGEVSIPLCTTNRINNPYTAEEVLASGSADMISMARPFLADANFVKKAATGKADEINICIGCNQACLDHSFSMKRASCLVNPQSGYEKTLKLDPVQPNQVQNIAVVGAGPAGLAFATNAARRGHKVTLFEKDKEIGGQFNMAKLIPGKEEFYETLKYFQRQITLTGVTLHLNKEVTSNELRSYDSVVVATGVLPRDVKIPIKTDKVKCLSYINVLRDKAKVGDKVAIIGAGGIGFDVAEFITHDENDRSNHGPLPGKVDESSISKFMSEWGIDSAIKSGGLSTNMSAPKVQKTVYMLQRKKGKLGAGLGKTTGWIHRSVMKKRGVKEMDECKYIEINDSGLLIERMNKKMTLDVDTVIFCAGQISFKSLYDPLTKGEGKLPSVFLIGGAQAAGELDAKRAIDQGTRLAAVIENAKTGEVFEQPDGGWMPKLVKFIGQYLR
jgi:2,4-dienoyl-CoA reductase (NADPH2)